MKDKFETVIMLILGTVIILGVSLGHSICQITKDRMELGKRLAALEREIDFRDRNINDQIDCLREKVFIEGQDERD